MLFVQIIDGGTEKIAEVQYFFQADVQGSRRTFALVSVYSPPNDSLLKRSSGALAVCTYRGSTALKVVPTTSILSVVGMVPFPSGGENDFFLVEKLGLDIAHLGGFDEDLGDE